MDDEPKLVSFRSKKNPNLYSSEQLTSMISRSSSQSQSYSDLSNFKRPVSMRIVPNKSGQSGEAGGRNGDNSKAEHHAEHKHKGRGHRRADSGASITSVQSMAGGFYQGHNYATTPGPKQANPMHRYSISHANINKVPFITTSAYQIGQSTGQSFGHRSNSTSFTNLPEIDFSRQHLIEKIKLISKNAQNFKTPQTNLSENQIKLFHAKKEHLTKSNYSTFRLYLFMLIYKYIRHDLESNVKFKTEDMRMRGLERDRLIAIKILDRIIDSLKPVIDFTNLLNDAFLSEVEEVKEMKQSLLHLDTSTITIETIENNPELWESFSYSCIQLCMENLYENLSNLIQNIYKICGEANGGIGGNVIIIIKDYLNANKIYLKFNDQMLYDFSTYRNCIFQQLSRSKMMVDAIGKFLEKEALDEAYAENEGGSVSDTNTLINFQFELQQSKILSNLLKDINSTINRQVKATSGPLQWNLIIDRFDDLDKLSKYPRFRPLFSKNKNSEYSLDGNDLIHHGKLKVLRKKDDSGSAPCIWVEHYCFLFKNCLIMFKMEQNGTESKSKDSHSRQSSSSQNPAQMYSLQLESSFGKKYIYKYYPIIYLNTAKFYIKDHETFILITPDEYLSNKPYYVFKQTEGSGTSLTEQNASSSSSSTLNDDETCWQEYLKNLCQNNDPNYTFNEEDYDDQYPVPLSFQRGSFASRSGNFKSDMGNFTRSINFRMSARSQHKHDKERQQKMTFTLVRHRRALETIQNFIRAYRERNRKTDDTENFGEKSVDQPPNKFAYMFQVGPIIKYFQNLSKNLPRKLNLIERDWPENICPEKLTSTDNILKEIYKQKMAYKYCVSSKPAVIIQKLYFSDAAAAKGRDFFGEANNQTQNLPLSLTKSTKRNSSIKQSKSRLKTLTHQNQLEQYGNSSYNQIDHHQGLVRIYKINFKAPVTMKGYLTYQFRSIYCYNLTKTSLNGVDQSILTLMFKEKSEFEKAKVLEIPTGNSVQVVEAIEQAPGTKTSEKLSETDLGLDESTDNQKDSVFHQSTAANNPGIYIPQIDQKIIIEQLPWHMANYPCLKKSFEKYFQFSENNMQLLLDEFKIFNGTVKIIPDKFLLKPFKIAVYLPLLDELGNVVIRGGKVEVIVKYFGHPNNLKKEAANGNVGRSNSSLGGNSLVVPGNELSLNTPLPSSLASTPGLSGLHQQQYLSNFPSMTESQSSTSNSTFINNKFSYIKTNYSTVSCNSNNSGTTNANQEVTGPGLMIPNGQLTRSVSNMSNGKRRKNRNGKKSQGSNGGAGVRENLV